MTYESFDIEVEIVLDDMDQWELFSRDNSEALTHEYGSVANALKHACDGGLTLGGGASPVTFIRFSE